MYVILNFATLFSLPYSRVKKCANFKTNILSVSFESFLNYLIPKKKIFEYFYFHTLNIWWGMNPFLRKSLLKISFCRGPNSVSPRLEHQRTIKQMIFSLVVIYEAPVEGTNCTKGRSQKYDQYNFIESFYV